MPIDLYVAPAGAGKTAYALDTVREAARGLRCSPRVCVANPLQVRAWRVRLAQAGGALGVRVSTFDELHDECLDAAGEVCIEVAEPVQYRLIRTLVNALPLAHFGPLRHKPGFIQVLQGLIPELKAARVRPEDLRNAVATLGNPPRLTDLADVYAAYQERLQARGWVDRPGRAWLAVHALSRTEVRLDGDWSLLVVDGFDNFTAVQIELLRLLSGHAGRTIITLTGAPVVAGSSEPEAATAQRSRAHGRFDRTRVRLEAALGARAEPLPAQASRHAPALAHLEANLFNYGARAAAPGAVELIEATDRAGEVRAALRWLKARIVLDGLRPDETALLAREIVPYRQFVVQTAAEFGLPIRLIDGLPLRSNPAVAALLDLLALVLPGAADDPEPALPWRHVVEAWRSPYFDWAAAYSTDDRVETIGITDEDAGALDAAARQARVGGGLRQWRDMLDSNAGPDADVEDLGEEGATPGADVGREIRKRLRDKFLRFVARITPPPGEHSYREFVAWVEDLIGADPTAQAARYPEGDEPTSLRMVERIRAAAPEVKEWDLAALVELKDVLRGLVLAEEALASEADDEARPDFAHFYAECVDLVQSRSYLPRPVADRREILVADVVQARGLSPRAVAVLGLGEGEFPAPRQEDPFLRDADRRHMRDALGLQIDLSTDSAESEYFYETVTRPRERLLLVRSRLADNGATWKASPYWEEVCRLVAVQPEQVVSDAALRPERAASWEELMESWAARSTDAPCCSTPDEKPEAAEAARRWASVRAAGTVFRARYAGTLSGGPFDGELAAWGDLLVREYGPARLWSASRLETYRACPFMFFVGAVLGLQPRAEPIEGLDAGQLGILYHRIFERLYAAVENPTDAAKLLAALPSIVTEVLDEAPHHEDFRATAWWDQTRLEIQALAARSVQALALEGPEFVPRHFEQVFGKDGAPPLILRDGDEAIRLRGVIDRVDVASDGGLRVIDYKTSGPSRYGATAILDGKKLQLPLYALAARDALGLGEPREAFYWHVQQAEPSSFRLSSLRGGPQAAYAAATKATWTAVRGIRGGQFVPHPPDLGCPSYCAAASFCWRYRPGFGG